MLQHRNLHLLGNQLAANKLASPPTLHKRFTLTLYFLSIESNTLLLEKKVDPFLKTIIQDTQVYPIFRYSPLRLSLLAVA